MADTEQILSALRNRIKGLKAEAEYRNRQSLKQKMEELELLLEMLERSLAS